MGYDAITIIGSRGCLRTELTITACDYLRNTDYGEKLPDDLVRYICSLVWKPRVDFFMNGTDDM